MGFMSLQLNAFLHCGIQGEQRICERSWKYNAISQKVDNPALNFFTYLELLIQKKEPISDERLFR